MDNYKFTKGKWETYKPEHILCYNVALGEANGFNGYVELWYHHYDNPQEAKANALLISKAPEMLEMIKKLMAYMPKIDIKDANIYYEALELIKDATEI